MSVPKRPALGRGLDSLISMDDTPARGSSAINDIAIDRITPNPDQPRSIFDEEALEELARSIRELGIIQPL
ncbi:MAG TPA: chromosome partitioning protein ParB, partial [Porphyromonadaceae bacterium]|nr:chromosome partitioning protein ParB [Porphyromonadaceae bacterium]